MILFSITDYSFYLIQIINYPNAIENIMYRPPRILRIMQL